MYNYNRDVYQAEFERADRMRAAAERQVPLHLRADTGKRLAKWLSANVSGPALAALSEAASLAGLELARSWRRASSRAAGLAVNAAKGLAELAPG